MGSWGCKHEREKNVNLHEFELCLWRGIKRMAKIMKRLLTSAAEREGLSVPQARIIMYLKIHTKKAVTLRDICCGLEGNQGNISTLCKNLEKAGYIKKERGKQDERIVYIKLTSLGADSAERMEQHIKSLVEPILSTISEESMKRIMLGFAELEKAGRLFQMTGGV